MFSLTQTTGRQREIIEVVFGNGWDYMRGLLTGEKLMNPKFRLPKFCEKFWLNLARFMSN